MNQMIVFFKGVGGGALIKALPASKPKAGKDDEGTGQPGDCGEECEYGPHNVKPGHHIAFEAGAFHGAGKVASAGEDGAVVSDHSGREHRIHWHEVKGHFEKDTGQDGGSSGAPLKKSHVSGYTRKDGTFVAEHEDSRTAAAVETGSKKRKAVSKKVAAPSGKQTAAAAVQVKPQEEPRYYKFNGGDRDSKIADALSYKAFYTGKSDDHLWAHHVHHMARLKAGNQTTEDYHTARMKEHLDTATKIIEEENKKAEANAKPKEEPSKNNPDGEYQDEDSWDYPHTYSNYRSSNAAITARNGGVPHQFASDIGGSSSNYR